MRHSRGRETPCADRVCSTVRRGAALTTRLEEPVALLGLRSQQVGTVERVLLDPQSRRIAYYEFRTAWQRLLVAGDSVVFDERRAALRLRRNAMLIDPPTGEPQGFGADS